MTKKHLRLTESAALIRHDDEGSIAFHHTVFCQTALPYRRSLSRIWERSNGFLSLRVEAGTALHPQNLKWMELPLPFGAKSRLILIHFDTLAIQNQTPEIQIEDSMTAFLEKLQGYAPNGEEIADFRDHAAAITGALFRFATTSGDRTFQIDTKIITSFELWYPEDGRQHTLWPSHVRLSDEYFRTLIHHAVPLDQRAIKALKHSALALDIYKWLSQRLYRVPENQPAFVPWNLVQAQFGQGYTEIRFFRRAFLHQLKAVLTQYPDARIEVDDHGLTLRHSRPPIAPRLIGDFHSTR